MTKEKDRCPRCGEKAVTFINEPHRKIKLAHEKDPYNRNSPGDLRKMICEFCNWWSQARWNGKDWIWKTAPPISAGQRARLNERLKEIKKKRRRKR